MRKYKNVMRNTIILRNGTKIPAGHIIELSPEIAREAGAALKPIDNLPADIPYYQTTQQESTLSDADREKLDKVSSLLEQFPDLMKAMTEQVAASVKENVTVTVNQVGGQAAPSAPTIGNSNEPVPIILDDTDLEVQSNLSEAPDAKTEESTAFKDKLKKLREQKQKETPHE